MFTATKTFKFEGAHVLKTSFSEECQHIHGHSYEVEVTLMTETLNVDGMVVDFKLLKEIASPIFDEFDHALLLHSDQYIKLLETCPALADFGWKIITMGNVNPTAENMAKHFFEIIDACMQFEDFSNYPRVAYVEVKETKTGRAGYGIETI